MEQRRSLCLHVVVFVETAVMMEVVVVGTGGQWAGSPLPNPTVLGKPRSLPRFSSGRLYNKQPRDKDPTPQQGRAGT